MSNQVSRRDLLKWASAGAGAASVGAGAWFLGRDDSGSDLRTSASRSTTPGTDKKAPPSSDGTANSGPAQTTPAATAGSRSGGAVKANSDLARRLLVVVEMDGGNDGMSMVVPYGTGKYYDLRQATSIPAEKILKIDDSVGYADMMTNIHRRGAAVVEGVGSFKPDLSHFEMMNRWWRGDPNNANGWNTGFLGRLADVIGDPSAAAVAVSARGGSHPFLVSQKAPTIGLAAFGAARYLTGASPDDHNATAFQKGIQSFAGAGGDGFLGGLRNADARAITFAESVSGLVDESGLRPDYPDNDFTRGLSMAMSLFLVDQGVRIVHIPGLGDFDTHDDHVSRHGQLMATFDAGIEAFMADLEANDLADRVLIMTTSEFGRRAGDNGSSGLDHGTASNALLMGPVNVGRYGEQPSFTDLEDDNFKATIGFDQYMATVAESWFGIPASDVLNGNVKPLEGIIAV